MMVSKTGTRTGERIRKPEAMIGMILLGNYPAHNFRGIRLRYEPRRVLIETVRLMRKTPVEDATREAEPTLRRFGVLIGGRDLDKGLNRHFYLGAFESWSLHKPTPSIVFPQLEYDIVRCGELRRRCVSDPRGLFSKHYLEDFSDALVLPASSAIVCG